MFLPLLKHRAAWLRRIRWLAGGIAVAVLALAVAWVLFVPAADWLAHHDVGSASGPLHETALDNARGRLLTLGAGLFAAGALVFTVRNFTLSREGQVTDRYTKAIEQLGSDKLDVCLGGIYALERIARDSARDHPTVIEVLSAFIREHSHEDNQEQERSTRPDVQAAITVVGRRDAGRDILFRPLDLTGAVLPGAHLEDANLVNAVLAGANLAGAVLTGAILAGAVLEGANLTGADLTPGKLSLTPAVLAGRGSTARIWPARTSSARTSTSRTSPARETSAARASVARTSATSCGPQVHQFRRDGSQVQTPVG